MKPFRVILAVFLSLLVAMPLCCCSAKAAPVKEASGCCQTEKDVGDTDRGPMACACNSLDAKEMPETVRLPDAGGKEFVSHAALGEEMSAPRILPASASVRPGVMDDPPGKIFARYSRWII